MSRSGLVRQLAEAYGCPKHVLQEVLDSNQDVLGVVEVFESDALNPLLKETKDDLMRVIVPFVPEMLMKSKGPHIRSVLGSTISPKLTAIYAELRTAERQVQTLLAVKQELQNLEEQLSTNIIRQIAPTGQMQVDPVLVTVRNCLSQMQTTCGTNLELQQRLAALTGMTKAAA